MNWLMFALLSISAYGFYNFFARLSAGKFSPAIVALFITGISFLVTVVVVIAQKLLGQNLVFSKNEMLFPILAGLSVGIAEVFYMLMFSKNAPLSIGTPLVTIGISVMVVLLGMIFLKENLTLIKMFAMLLTIIGLIILSRN